uniref:Uncharacterized protein n=1 Tax=Anguilla anguilla TaxID=7936 RepID=A0A0E9PIS8_ANGAN
MTYNGFKYVDKYIWINV